MLVRFRSTAGMLVGSWMLVFASIPAVHAERSAESTQIRAEIGLPPTHPVIADGWHAFTNAVEERSNGRLEIKLFLNGPPIGSSAALENLASGRSEMGFLSLASHPESFPHAAFLVEVAMAGGDGLAAAAAVTELFMLHCPDCQAAFAKHGLVFLGTYSAAPYILICSTELSTAGSWTDRRVATPGSLWDRVVTWLGGTPLGHEGTPAESLASGEADGIIDIAAALREPGVWSATHSVVTGPFGAYRAASPFTANLEFWRDLKPRERKALIDAAPAGIVAATWAYQLESEQILSEAVERGVHISEVDPLLEDQIRTFADDDMDRVVESAEERLGLSSADQVLTDLRALYDKYVTLLGPEVRTPEQAAGVLAREIFDRLDPEAYGLEPERH